MRTDPALRRAFAGCGLVLNHVRSTKRYRELLHQNRGDTMGATLDLLGEALVEKAWNCLPKPDQHQTQYWSQLDADQQLQAQIQFMRRLYNPESHAYPENPDETPYLPTKMGKWDEPGVQRNCLGLAILTAACAQRYPHSRYYFASVQRLAAEPVFWGLQELYGRALGIIVSRLPHDTGAGLVEILKDHLSAAREDAELLTERDQFHGAVTLQLGDGRWVCLDAYQHNVSIFPPERAFFKVDATFRGNGNIAAAITFNGSPRWTDLPAFSAELDTISLLADEHLLTALEIWARRVWSAAQHAATSTPHYALSISAPLRSLAVRVLLNERLRCGQPRAIDLLRYSHMDNVLYHAIKDSLDGQPLTGDKQTLLISRIEESLRIPAIYRHPLLNKVLEEVRG